jgi:hypothetical protein
LGLHSSSRPEATQSQAFSGSVRYGRVGCGFANIKSISNSLLGREGFEAFYDEDVQLYIRHIGSKTLSIPVNPHRPFTPNEVKRRLKLASYLDSCTEDDLIEQILLALLRQLGFHRISAAGLKDKAMEYGKHVWMRYVLPTQHVLYFGNQAKRGKLDASRVSRGTNANNSEIYNQDIMMLGHELYDPETSKRVLVDHALIIAGGEITKQARSWLGGKLDATKRSQIMFIDRDDILNLYVVSGLPLPEGASPSIGSPFDDEVPF